VADLRIFSYIPNPRLAKAKIAGRLSGADIQVKGDSPRNLVHWLWDFDARELSECSEADLEGTARKGTVGFSGRTLFKTDDFLQAHPFGNVPAAFSGDGSVGIFESNAIMRAAARCGPHGNSLLGTGPLIQSRIDSFVDRSLVFSCTLQRYLLGGKRLTPDLYGEMKTALHSYASGLSRALEDSLFLVNGRLTLADIAVVCELCQLTYESYLTERLEDLKLAPLVPSLAESPAIGSYMERLSRNPVFREEIGELLDKLAIVWA